MPKTNAQYQQAWRQRRASKKLVLDRWREHNRLIITRQEDGGYRIQVEQSPEGRRLTAELAELCGESPDLFMEKLISEALGDMQGRFVPASKQVRKDERN